MKNMKVSKKLTVSFLIVIAFSVLLGIAGILGMLSLNNVTTSMYEYNIIPIQAMSDLRELFANERNALRNIFLSKDNPETVQSVINSFTEYDRIAQQAFADYEGSITPGTEANETDFFQAKEAYLGDFAKMKQEMFALFNQGEFDRAYEVFTSNTHVIAPITNGLDNGAKFNMELANTANKNAEILYVILTVVVSVILLVSIVISLYLSLYISGLISKPLVVLTAFMKKAGETGNITLTEEETISINKYSEIQDEIGECINSCSKFIKRLTEISVDLEKVANGDLSNDIKLLSDHDVMGKSLDLTIRSLNEMFADIHNASEQVTMGATQISDGAQALASGSTEQAATVEQLSASISEIAGKTKQSSEMAKNASELASNIMARAESGSEQMKQMIEAVNEINQANQSISQVIKVIDDIAFQTNILALNAAVEAARAGEHGKGFAVVADEVRNLASKSAESAKNTASLIENSLEKAELGTKIATETSESLNIIVGGIKDSNSITAQIADSAEEQYGAIEQINSAITEVTDVVQQNSATAEESAAAAEEMSGQATMLESLIARFKLKVK